MIDHHRRGESFISNPLLVYMEPYASSTAELVTELLEYQPTEQRLTRLESTVMQVSLWIHVISHYVQVLERLTRQAIYVPMVQIRY